MLMESCALEDGLVYSFGRNDYGQLGLGDKNPHLLPQLVSLLEDKVFFFFL